MRLADLPYRAYKDSTALTTKGRDVEVEGRSHADRKSVCPEFDIPTRNPIGGSQTAISTWDDYDFAAKGNATPAKVVEKMMRSAYFPLTQR